MIILGDRLVASFLGWALRRFRILVGALLAGAMLAGYGSAQEAALNAPPRIAPGSAFEIGWQGPDAPGDFIAIAGPGAPAASFLAYARTSAGSPAVMTAPGAGEYELRYISAAGLAVLARVSLSVGAEPAKGGITAPS